MLKLLKLLNLSSTSDAVIAPHLAPAAIDSAIEMVVDGTEPRIRLVPGYKKKLQAGVVTALNHIEQLVDTIPAAITVDSHAYLQDPNVNTFFVDEKDMRQIFSESEELRNFFADHAHDGLDAAYALLCMSQSEKSVLGVELTGDMLRREVMQTAVNFYEHTVLSPAASETEIRSSLKHCIFNGLITYSLRKIADSKLHLNELEDQRRILFTRLRSRLAKGDKLTSLLSSVAVPGEGADEISSQLAQAERSLQELPAYKNAPKAYLDEVNAVLMHPEQFIRLKQYAMTLTKMCIKAEQNASEPTNTICLNEIEIANVLKRAIAIVRFPRAEMQVIA